VRVMRKDGTDVPVEVTFSTVDTPEGRVITLALRDVTERREFEARLAHQATHDRLTGLPNRELFMERLAAAIRYPPADGAPVQVFFVDLDHVKYLNDSRGPLVGDELIVNVARRLTERLGGAFVARLSGDEFGLLAGGLTDGAAVRGFAQRIMDAFDSPFPVGGVEHHLTASIGISAGIIGAQADEILRNAESALHLAKANGRDRFEFFDQALTQAAAERLSLESALHRALARDELLLRYQPVVALGSGNVVGVEALLRWKRPGLGTVSPDRFITVAEDTGLIVPIGRWVLERACTQLAAWTRDIPGLECRMSVNVSNRQLEHDHFVEEVAAVLDTTGVDPAAVVLEITESCLSRDFDATLRRLHALHRLGVRLAVDDFGTGFSSLSALSALPVDIVKIDKTFVDGLGTRYAAVVSAVVTLARAFGLDVVAEGVEAAEQREQLLALGCTFAQGFYFSVPLDGREAGILLTGEPGRRDTLASADRDAP
jgi:diguanylate cyclase (GGDEF)-like protein